uniref:Peptidase M12B domain-containing protein n=1 Tax=Esox lucius TaxID=8010 RepID=A0A6Q2Z4L6_ESOLU
MNPNASFLQELPHYEVVHPSRVDAKGHFLSNFVSHRVSRLRRRETQDDPGSLARVFYQLQHGDHHLLFNLTLNPQLLAPGFLIERRYGGLEGAKISNRGSSLCHFIGEVWDRATVKGRAAISTCAGLTGLFRLSEEEFFIQPLEQPSDESSASQAHVIYKRHTRPAAALERVERQRERWERRQRKKRRIRQRSVSREKWVETLVVADSKMVEYHGSSGVESYVLAVMNIVSGLFRDASIGNPINIVVVRLILLEKEEEDLKISHHADNSLNSFCKWQKRLNVKGEENAVHHDVAVLITRKDICAAINKPCETLGLSHVAGMCQPHRSCSISEDTGLPLAFTIAHELGHNFGIQHDGNGNDCEPIGKRPFVMSPQLLYGNARPSWSRCSRQYITRFLDRGWGWCLDDPPLSDVKDLNSVPPGVLYSAAHQCRLQYGSGSLLCDDVDNVCSTLWCTVGVTCHSKLDGAVDGTRCGEDKWCFDGECVAVGYRPESVNGGWAAWSEWSACSRTCGGGVQNAHRDCVNPVPKYGGKYCTGERRRYKICNSSPCPLGQPSFRHVQCNHFNTMPYKGKFYKWVQVNNRVNPCELHCRPVNEYFSEKMLDAAIDGTQCYEGSTSRDMCINGICKNVGCDYKIDSNAVEDRCGVCHGNGSTCETVKKTFEESEGLGYVDIGLIPEGARDIRIEEVAEAGNFLALRSDDPDKYFLNGGWTIQWNGEYKAAGTVFTYERTGHLENLTSPGPTLEPVWIQLLFQETNPGVRYEYTIHRENLLDSDNNIPDFFWKYGSWTECSSTCGTGVQRQIVHCVERTSGIVEDRYCDPTTRPDDKRANCNEELCPAIWWVGEWQKCSATCGEQGLAKRTVLCIQAVGLEEKRALQPSECHHMPRPDSVTACNTHIPCPADWSAGNWSECSLTCGGGVRSREVVCSRNTGVDCDPRKKPSVLIACYLKDCPQIIDIGNNDWSGSGSSSINSIPEANPVPKHSTTRGQPKANNGNNIIPQRNDIEKTPDKSAKNNVPVDDFYYDYNFIKFHEDISYDFDLGSNGKDLGDAPGLVPQQKPKIDSSQTTTTGSQAEMESLVPPLESPSLGTVLDYKIYQDRIFTMTLAQPDEAQTPTTTLSLPFEPPASDSTEDYNGYFPGEPDFDQQDLENESTSDSKADLLVTGRDLTEASKPVTQEPRLSPSPHTAFGRTISENKGNIKHNSATTGSESIPPTHPEVVPRSRPPSIPTETEPATDEQGTDFPTQSSTTGGRQSEGASVRPPAPPRNRWLEIDYNEILVPPMLRSRGTVSSLTHQPPMGATPTTPRDVKRSMPSTLSPGPTTLPARSPTTPLSAPELTPLPSPVVTAAFWRAGDWSACSTSCGLGAIWRLVTCSTGLDTDCGLAERPVPARRCYLRPCSLWRLGNWTKCSKNCGSGVTSREIQCFDTRDQRPLRPFHCQIMSTRPVAQMPCNTQPCLTWYSSSWGQCSEVCGGGEQQRLVTCPEENRCDEDFVPSNIQACNSQPCAQWVTGSWGPCSASCGGGVQRRLVKCVNTKVENEEEHAQCDHEPWPENTQKCNLQDCDSIPSPPWVTGSLTLLLTLPSTPQPTLKQGH